jgi:hypothetical protein
VELGCCGGGEAHIIDCFGAGAVRDSLEIGHDACGADKAGRDGDDLGTVFMDGDGL